MNIRSPGRGLSNKILKIYDTVLPEFFPESKNFYGELTNYLRFAEEFNTGGKKDISIELAKLLSTIHEFLKKEETRYMYIYLLLLRLDRSTRDEDVSPVRSVVRETSRQVGQIDMAKGFSRNSIDFEFKMIHPRCATFIVRI